MSDIEQDDGFLDSESLYDQDLTNSVVRLIGNKTTLCQVVQLLAYIRNAIKNNRKMKITVDIGSIVDGGKLMFDVNQQEVPDYVAQDYININ